jgi:hypothetical protein
VIPHEELGGCHPLSECIGWSSLEDHSIRQIQYQNGTQSILAGRVADENIVTESLSRHQQEGVVNIERRSYINTVVWFTGWTGTCITV